MKLFKAMKLKRKCEPAHTKPPPLETDTFVKFACHCIACGELTGATKDIRSTLINEEDMKHLGVDPSDPKIRDGMCARCSNALASGQTIVINQSGTRSVIMTKEATDTKLAEEARGKFISIPDQMFLEQFGPAIWARSEDCPKESAAAAVDKLFPELRPKQ